MGALEIILLAGVIGVWVAVTMVVAAAMKAQKTMGRLEMSVERLEREFSALAPKVGSALDSVDRTGREISRTAETVGGAVEALSRNAHGGAVLGVLKYLPAALGLARFVLPLLRRRRR